MKLYTSPLEAKTTNPDGRTPRPDPADILLKIHKGDYELKLTRLGYEEVDKRRFNRVLKSLFPNKSRKEGKKMPSERSIESLRGQLEAANDCINQIQNCLEKYNPEGAYYQILREVNYYRQKQLEEVFI